MRDYKVFGSKDGATWHYLDNVEVSTSYQAMRHAFDTHGESFKQYAAVPERNWTQDEPTVVERTPVVSWKGQREAQPKEQMTVDDVIASAEKEGVLGEMRGEPGPGVQKGTGIQADGTPTPPVRR